MITNDSKNDGNEAKEVIQAGKDLAPLFAFGQTQPIAADPKPLIAKKTSAGSEPLKNERHERFCQLVAYGDGEGGSGRCAAFGRWGARRLTAVCPQRAMMSDGMAVAMTMTKK